MGGSASVPTVLGGLSGGQQNLSLIDADFTAITQYINTREITVGPVGSRPAAGVAGRWYFATDVNGGTLYEDTGASWQQVAPGLTQAQVLQVLIGLTLSNDGATPNTVLDVAAGSCTSDDATLADRVVMSPGALTGTTGGTWVAGTGQPKLDAGVVGTSQWWHVFVIQRTDTGATDLLFSLSPSAPTMPSSYTKKRRIGAVRVDGAGNILAFVQAGDLFQWATSFGQEINVTNPGTAAVTRTLTVPTGVNVLWQGTAAVVNPGLQTWLYLSDLATVDQPASGIGQLYVAAGVGQGSSCQLAIRTNTSAQLRSRLSASDGTTQLVMTTTGWTDRRGQDS